MTATAQNDPIADAIRNDRAIGQNTVEQSVLSLADSDGKKAVFTPSDMTKWSGHLFVRNREGMHADPFTVDAVLEYIKSAHSVAEAKRIEGYEANREIFLKTTTIENMLLNSMVNNLYKEDQITSNNIDNNDTINPILKLILLRFYSIKNMEVYKSSGDHKQDIISNIDIRKRALIERIKATAQEAFSAACRDEADRQAFLDEIVAELKGIKPKLELPEKAPELYKERADRKEKPDAFIRRVYGEWLGQGLLRPHVKDLDKPLYQGLYKHGIPTDFDDLLPTAQGRSSEEISRSDAELLEAKRASRRQADRKRRLASELAY